MTTAFPLQEGVPLAPRTTLEVGGPARYLAVCTTAEDVERALTEARQRQIPIAILGGGSNLLIADEGFDGQVVELRSGLVEGVEPRRDGEDILLRASAGVEWDAVVDLAVTEGWAGIEALSGIPGRVGAAPIQNIGAYGQELSEVVESVEVLELVSGSRRTLAARECGFGYRRSHFKGRWRDRFLVTAVTLRLRPGGAATVRYGDLQRYFQIAAGEAPPPLKEVRDGVLEIRRSKSMVHDAASAEDPNRRSAGSFFVNPVVLPTKVEAVRQAAEEMEAGNPPVFPSDEGSRLKLSAAWLIEAAGFERGFCEGRVGLSSRHALAIINRGGAEAAEVVAFARRIRRAVRRCFGVTLRPEPVFLGFRQPVEQLLG